MTFRRFLCLISATALVWGCTSSETPRPSADDVTEIALADVPQDVAGLVKATRTDFTMIEVLKKVRDGRVYYDVEGALANGDEIEFDVLMTPSGPEIVEIQRDLIWDDVPVAAQNIVEDANTDKLDITRVIESVQTDQSIIYEVFVAGHPADPRFEVRMVDGHAELLAARWEH